MAAVIGFSFKERFLRFQFPDFYPLRHVIWRMKWAQKLKTKNGQNMSSVPFSHDAAHIVVSEPELCESSCRLTEDLEFNKLLLFYYFF